MATPKKAKGRLTTTGANFQVCATNLSQRDGGEEDEVATGC